jgi:hypothetical protein
MNDDDTVDALVNVLHGTAAWPGAMGTQGEIAQLAKYLAGLTKPEKPMSDLQRLAASVEEAPRDAALRLVYSDALEDADRMEEASWQRTLAEVLAGKFTAEATARLWRCRLDEGNTMALRLALDLAAADGTPGQGAFVEWWGGKHHPTPRYSHCWEGEALTGNVWRVWRDRLTSGQPLIWPRHRLLGSLPGGCWWLMGEEPPVVTTGLAVEPMVTCVVPYSMHPFDLGQTHIMAHHGGNKYTVRVMKP